MSALEALRFSDESSLGHIEIMGGNNLLIYKGIYTEKWEKRKFLSHLAHVSAVQDLI